MQYATSVLWNEGVFVSTVIEIVSDRDYGYQSRGRSKLLIMTTVVFVPSF
jgi:hypothetical protein